jgi:DNA polymerase I
VFGQKVTFGNSKTSFEHWEVPEEDEDEERGTPVAEQIKTALVSGPKTKLRLAELLGANTGTLANNLSALVNAGDIITLDRKIGRKVLYALPTGPYEGPDEDVVGPEDGVEESPTNDDGGTVITVDFGAKDTRNRLITTGEQLNTLVEEVKNAEVVAIDFETVAHDGPATDPRRCIPGVLSVATGAEGGAAVQVSKVDPGPLFEALQGKTLLGHNLKYDLRVARRAYGYEHDGAAYDTMIVHRLIHFASGKRLPENGKLMVPQTGIGESLATLVERYLGEELDKSEQVSDWLVDELTEEQVDYAITDTELLFRLKEKLDEELLRVEKVAREAGITDADMAATLELEGSFLPALTWLEDQGIPIDEEEWLRLADEAEARRDEAAARLADLEPPTEREDGWNWGSGAQLLEALDILGVDTSKLPKTEKGAPSTAESALKKAAKISSGRGAEFIEALLEYRAAAKFASTYGRSWFEVPQFRPKARVHKWSKRRQYVVDGRLGTDFVQIVRSGRVGSREPNAQNLPSARSSGHRAALRAPAGRVFVVADYKQIELLVASIVAPDEEMYKVLSTPDGDLHAATARSLLGDREVSEEEFKGYRQAAKAVNFGFSFGMGAKRFVDYAHDEYGVELTLEESKEYRKKFLEARPGIAAWHEAEKKKANEGTDLQSTISGRIRKISLSKYKDKDSWSVYLPERLNHRVQGSAADGMKAAIRSMYEARADAPGHAVPVDTVHDELVIEADADAVDEVVDWVRHHMVRGMRAATRQDDLPVQIEVDIADHYGEK